MESYALEDINPDNFDLTESLIPINEYLVGSCSNFSDFSSPISNVSSVETFNSSTNDIFDFNSGVEICQKLNYNTNSASTSSPASAIANSEVATKNVSKKSKNINKKEAEAKHNSNYKPPEPYADIISKAILSNPNSMMQLKEIYNFVSEK